MTISVHSGAPERGEVPCRQRRQRAAAVTAFGNALDAIGGPRSRLARLLGTSSRNLRRWRDGTRRPPLAAVVVVRLIVDGKVGLADVEQAATPSPIWTNGSSEEEPPAPLRAAPAPEEPPALAPRRAKTATFADGGPTTAEKVLALAEGSCRWPFNDPRHSGFRFCGRPIAEKGSYCKHHARLAYLPRRTGGGHGVRIGLLSARQDHGELVAHGPQPVPTHGRPSAPSALSATSAARPPSSQAAVSGSAPPPA